MEYDSPQIQAELELGKRAVVGSLGQIALFTVFAYATRYYSGHPGLLVVTGSLIVGFNLLRYRLALRQSAYYPGRRKLWSRLYVVAVLVPAAAWGAIFLSSIQRFGLKSYTVMITGIIASGISASITSSVTPDQGLARAFITLVMIPPFALLIERADPGAVAFAMIILIYYAFLWTHLRTQHETFWDGLLERSRFKAVLDTIPGMVAWIGPDMRFKGVNRAFAENFGEPLESFPGRSIRFLERAPACLRRLSDFMASNQERATCELTIAGHKGERSHLLVLRKTSHGPEVYLICIDIQELKEARDELERQRSKSEVISKQAALGEAISDIAHEVRNPLSATLTAAELIRKCLETLPIDEEKLKALAEKIIATSIRIQKIVTGLSRFSRSAETEPFTVTPIGQLVRESVELISQNFRASRVALRVPEFDDGLRIRCRPVEISQVLVNLLNNALDAVKARTQESPESWVRIDAAEEDGGIRLSVTDSGSGIPEPVRGRLFEQFFTTKPPGMGTGLGLSVSKRIIERHGGRLSYDPQSPHTTFVITLPLEREARAAPSSPESAA